VTLRVGLYIAGVLALLGAVYWLAWTWDPFDRRERLERRAEAAEQQADLNAGATQAVEHVYRVETTVRTQTEEAAHVIESAPGAETPLPDDLRAAWRAGIDGVRQSAEAAHDPGS
jgi:hypothetical protein